MVFQGSQSEVAAAPYLSGDNGNNFGNNPSTGQDNSPYLVAGAGGAGNTITFNFSQGQMYLGLLWGSVDNSNVLKFYDGSTYIGEVTGSELNSITKNSDNQGLNGTVYANINSDTAFNRVVAIGNSPSFEFDNMAFSQHNVDIPEPGVLGLLGLGLLLMSLTPSNRRNSMSNSMIA
ncbi:PEP-CTERM sorting domain-containing protein [Candidatus Nitrosacidococcus sp. I8]|uniref:Npun_F0296 family exosortase-dependent surface protein n=1 Tax=Candidatus Nitrosacidococcus sp. I8 TaxID=2942908 RepID=UPI0022264100|nr:PEP-CTERM sorting domain-containing protein [Candidatus Nitrosacidococcus sp. I8]CAH9018281.1 hypothetical protein NURINAE_00834 [Candidatus Nitrosacidococcus sp. I8]